MNTVFTEAIRRYGSPYVANLCGAIIAGLSPFCKRTRIAEINAYEFELKGVGRTARLFLQFSDMSQTLYQTVFFLPSPETIVDDWKDTTIAFVYLLSGLETPKPDRARMSESPIYRFGADRRANFEPRWYVNGSTWNKDLPLKLALAMIEEAKRCGIPVVANVGGFPVLATGLDSPIYLQEVIKQTLRATARAQTNKSELTYEQFSGGLLKNADGTYGPGRPFDDIYKFSYDLVAEAQSRVSLIVGKFNGRKIEVDVWDSPEEVAARYLRLKDTATLREQDDSMPNPESLCPYTTKGRRMEI